MQHQPARKTFNIVYPQILGNRMSPDSKAPVQNLVGLGFRLQGLRPHATCEREDDPMAGKLLGLGHECGIWQRQMQVTLNDSKMDKRKNNG